MERYLNFTPPAMQHFGKNKSTEGVGNSGRNIQWANPLATHIPSVEHLKKCDRVIQGCQENERRQGTVQSEWV